MKNIEFNKITWYSKLAAVILFIGALPAWTFYIGMQYEKTLDAIQAASFAGIYSTSENPAKSGGGAVTGTVPSCAPSATTTSGEVDKSADIASSLPLTFKIFYTETKDSVCGNQYVFKNIQVAKNGSVVQTLNVGDNEGAEDILNTDSYLQIQDMNFDGYKDIGILSSLGATGNAEYYYWLYNPNTGLFEFNNDLSQMTNPTAHAALKEIVTNSNGGDAGLIYETDTYIYRDGKYILIRSENQDEAVPGNGTKFRKIIKELKNGVMTTTSDTIVAPDQNQN